MTESPDPSPGPGSVRGTDGAPRVSGAGHRGPRATAPGVDRAAALAAGTPGIPRKFVYWVLAAAGVLSLGGLVGEHLFSSAGLNPVSSPSPGARPAWT